MWMNPVALEGNGQFEIPRDYSGHGIGQKLHEPPHIPNRSPYYPGQGPCGSPDLAPGQLIAIEPMAMIGSPAVVVDPDGTVRTKSGLPAAHFEHTVWVTRMGPVVLTKIPS